MRAHIQYAVAAAAILRKCLASLFQTNNSTMVYDFSEVSPDSEKKKSLADSSFSWKLASLLNGIHATITCTYYES